VKAGFDSVVFDLSALPLEEDARSTHQAVEQLKSNNPAVVIEGEIGDIGSGSDIHADGPSADHALTTPQEARQFVTETKVDVLAPAPSAVAAVHDVVSAGQNQARGFTSRSPCRRNSPVDSPRATPRAAIDSPAPERESLTRVTKTLQALGRSIETPL
jgi:hypothetical protein